VTDDGRGAFYIGDRNFVVRRSAPVPPGAGEVRIDVAYTGICGTDLHILHGAMDSRVARPAVLGHEMSGRVAELGDGVAGWTIGDRVTVMPLAWCGGCPACHAGHTHICHRLNFIGIDSPGAMQSSWTVPAARLVRLPVELSLRDGALVEPTAVAVHDVRRSRLCAGEHAVVVGAGPVGLLIACVARHTGADVLVVEIEEHRRVVAEELGFRTVDPTTTEVPAFVEDWTGGAGADVAFEVSGAAAGVHTAVYALGVRGRLVAVAIHPSPREVDLHRVFWRELEIIGVRVYQRTDFEEAVRLLADRAVPAAQLISVVVPLDEVMAAFATLESGTAIKVLVDCGAVDDGPV
jgi:(R,R)-butanediol dehydrogenase / meso-butanediol dehydrogenase / diacetyl reductase